MGHWQRLAKSELGSGVQDAELLTYWMPAMKDGVAGAVEVALGAVVVVAVCGQTLPRLK